MTEAVETLVIGAGVVGLAVARSLALAGHEVLVVEKCHDIGTETSSRNSEVVHGGIYYPRGSLKARLCVEGREALYAFCQTWGVGVKRLGKLIVATTEAEIPKLRALRETGVSNGVVDLEWLSAGDVARVEPELRCKAALLSPSTGIVDSHGFMVALGADAEAHGATVALRTEFVSARAGDHAFDAELRAEDGDSFAISCGNIVNCAGHGAHAAAGVIAGYDKAFMPPRFLAKGSYCNVSGASPFQRLVYPIPVPSALGVHVTLDLGNRARLGPNIEWIESMDYRVDESIVAEFREASAAFWPGVRARELTTAYSGIRPKVHGPDKASADFIIQGPDIHGLKGLVNLFGIESPGLTSSLAIGEHVRALLERGPAA